MITLTKKINTKTGQEVYALVGDTFPVKDKIKALGFRWWGQGKFWHIPPSRLTPEKIKALSTFADVSEFDDGATPTPPTPPTQEPVSTGTTVQEFTNKTDTDSGKNFRDIDREGAGGFGYDRVPGDKWYGFPIKTNIYSTEIPVDIDGQEIPIIMILDRWYRKGVRKVPHYKINLLYKKNKIGTLGTSPPEKSQWGEYNEDKLALEIPDKIKNTVAKKEKLYKIIKYNLALEQRDPEFVQILEKWQSAKWDDKKFIYQYIPQKTIQITEPPYEGEYKLTLNKVSNSIHLETNVDHTLAPREKTVGSFGIPGEIQNLEQFNQYIDEALAKNHDAISQTYIEYLKSFAFTEEQEEQSRGAMNEVVNMIGKNYDTSHFIDKLQELGYIRPNKKVKKIDKQPGFLPKDKIKWVVESKKVVNDAYTYTQEPSQFYSTIAYYLHRKVKNISSWTDMMLVSAINHWHKLSERFGHEISYEEVDKYFNEISSQLYRELFYKEPPRSTQEQTEDFYNQFGRGQERQPVPGSSGGLENFVNIVTQLGVDPNIARKNPKQVRNELAMKYHSDRTGDDPQSLQIMKNINDAYESVPQELKASNWYKKLIIAKNTFVK
jgi:hypothetical protein